MKAIIIGAILFCAALIGIGVYLSTLENGGGPRLTPLDASYTERLRVGGWARGSNTPKVEVIEYADFQCPACFSLYPVLKQSLEATADISQFTYRHYPLPQHNKAKQAALAAEAAGRQGKFWEMHELLYARQGTWAEQTTVGFGRTLEEYAQTLNLNLEQFKRDLKDPSLESEVDKDISAGNQISVSGTPTILINGRVLDALPANSESMIQLINEAAQAASPAATPTESATPTP